MKPEEDTVRRGTTNFLAQAVPSMDPRAQKTEAIGNACPMLVSSQISDMAELITAEFPAKAPAAKGGREALS